MKKKRRSLRRLLLLPIFLVLAANGLALLVKDSPLPASARQSLGSILPAGEDSAVSHLLSVRGTVDALRSREDYTVLDRIPVAMRQAIVSVEDRRFYSHPGFDAESIMRAALVNVQSGEIEEGASTITQQLAKNLFLTQERSFGRKAEEVALACALEIGYSKDEILELYLNTIYFGSGSYGIHAAAKEYFGKLPEELSLSEASMLAGLPNAPSLYSPYVDFMLAKKRQFVVLDAMEREGCISERQAEDAKIEPILLAHE